jgi:hypothetical protein
VGKKREEDMVIYSRLRIYLLVKEDGSLEKLKRKLLTFW